MSSWEENYDWIQDIYRAINPGLPEITLRQYKVSVSWLLIMTPEQLKKNRVWLRMFCLRAVSTRTGLCVLCFYLSVKLKCCGVLVDSYVYICKGKFRWCKKIMTA